MRVFFQLIKNVKRKNIVFNFPIVCIMADPMTPQSIAGTPASVSSVGDASGAMDHDVAMKIMALLQKNGFKNAEEALRRDLHIGAGGDSAGSSRPVSAMAVPDTPAPELASYETLKEDPANYSTQYDALVNMVENCLDRFKPELSCLLWPVFAHMYLELLCSGYAQSAHAFVEKYGPIQEDYYQNCVKTMMRIKSKDGISSSDLLQALRDNVFCVRISRDHLNVLKPFAIQYTIIREIMKTRMTVESMDSAPRPAEIVSAVRGGWLGEAGRSANKSKVLYGVLKEDFSSSAESMLSAEDESKKKRTRGKEGGKDKSSKKDANAPSLARIPLPEWSDRMKQDKALAAREARNMAKYGPEKHPSVCFYTILNSIEGASSARFCDDSTFLAAGFGDSAINVWALDQKIMKMKPVSQLDSIDKEANSVEEQMLESTNKECMTLRGHHGPVYSLSYSPDKRLLLSASEDSTVRLWSLQTWKNVCIYKPGAYPIWDVHFCNRGYYFVTGSADRMATLWSTDKTTPIRVFNGHHSDVNAVYMHPNCNYVITGSEDCTVRMWDVLNGQCVRCFPGHKGAVQSVTCSSDGKYIASGGIDGRAIVWDIGMGKMLAPSDLREEDQNSSIYSVQFSRDNNLLAYGGSNHSVRVLHLPSVTSELEDADLNPADPRVSVSSLNLCSYATKSSTVLDLHFTRSNLLMAAGAFNQ